MQQQTSAVTAHEGYTYTLYSLYTLYTVHTLYTLRTVYTLCTLYTQYTLYTLYTGGRLAPRCRGVWGAATPPSEGPDAVDDDRCS